MTDFFTNQTPKGQDVKATGEEPRKGFLAGLAAFWIKVWGGVKDFGENMGALAVLGWGAIKKYRFLQIYLVFMAVSTAADVYLHKWDSVINNVVFVFLVVALWASADAISQLLDSNKRLSASSDGIFALASQAIMRVEAVKKLARDTERSGQYAVPTDVLVTTINRIQPMSADQIVRKFLVDSGAPPNVVEEFDRAFNQESGDK